MQAQMNLKIKFRESFRPFAPAMLREHAAEWFDLPAGQESPYMLLVAAVRQEHRRVLGRQDQATMRTHPDLRQRVNLVRSTVPAITHVDYSARVQTVDEERNPRFYRLLQHFNELTGCPMLVNTSFNVRGEPIVCSPEEAYRCFQATDMDALVMEDVVVHKHRAGHVSSATARQQYLAQFQLD
jgi:carbamoyltransferase